MRVAVLGSGRGSNAAAILRAQDRGELGRATVVAILSDVPDAGILRLGRDHQVPIVSHVDPAPFRTKLDGPGEERWIAALQDAAPDLVVLAGFMRVLKHRLLTAFDGRIINLHPSLLPAFPGLDAIGQAWRAGVRITGCTVHWVTAGVDQGPIIDQAAVRSEPTDSLELLAARVHDAEHKLLPSVIARLSVPPRKSTQCENG